jgi:hypothetical protein
MAQDNLSDYLSKLDAWIDGDEDGDIPLEVLKARGVALPDAKILDDAALHDALWRLIRAMADIGIFVESTDHLSDRELYTHLIEDALLVRSVLVPGDPSYGMHIDIIGGFSEEDIRTYLTYYADEEERESFRADFEGEFPQSLPHPYDRDRLLPTHEERAFGNRSDA